MFFCTVLMYSLPLNFESCAASPPMTNSRMLGRLISCFSRDQSAVRAPPRCSCYGTSKQFQVDTIILEEQNLGNNDNVSFGRNNTTNTNRVILSRCCTHSSLSSSCRIAFSPVESNGIFTNRNQDSCNPYEENDTLGHPSPLSSC
jgi:hypothetical protein